MLRLLVPLALVLVAVTHCQADVIFDLNDTAVIGAFTSGDCDLSVAEGPTPRSHALGVVFKPVNDWPCARYQLPQEQNWTGASELVVTAHNDSATTATIEIGITDADGHIYKPARRLGPGAWSELRVPVRGMVLGSDQGGWCNEAVDVRRIVRVWFLAYSPAAPLPVRFAKIELLTYPRLAAPKVSATGASDGVALRWEAVPEARAYDIFRRAPGSREVRLARFELPRFVDTEARPGVRYGYRVAALNRLLERGKLSTPVFAQMDPEAHAALPARDRYWGRTDVKLRATGYFRLDRVNGRAVLVDPLGHPMLSVGICVIGLGDSYTRVTRREHLFEEALAEKADPRFRAAWDPPYGYAPYGLEAGSGLVFSPYVRNLIVKYGTDWAARWNAENVRRLDDWRINTAAAWSGGGLQRPYVSFTAGWGDCPLLPNATGGTLGIPDVFDPAFERNVTESAKSAAGAARDPYLIGWFTANEMPWHGDWERGMNVPNLIHAAAPALAAKQAWVAFLKERYGSIEALNSAWGTGFGDFAALEANREKMPNRPQPRADASAFLEAFADRYFGTIARAIRANDPNHLLLGVRHSQSAPSEVVRAESRHNDVVSATLYGLSPVGPVTNGSCDTTRPWISGEFHFQSADAGLPFRNVEGIFPDQAGRGEAYQNYLCDAFSMPNFVGAHWFEYIDEPATGRFDGGKDGGECHNIGWVNVQDEPYEEFVWRARVLNANLPLLVR